jgi:succinate-acetate transporter protein
VGAVLDGVFFVLLAVVLAVLGAGFVVVLGWWGIAPALAAFGTAAGSLATALACMREMPGRRR